MFVQSASKVMAATVNSNYDLPPDLTSPFHALGQELKVKPSQQLNLNSLCDQPQPIQVKIKHPLLQTTLPISHLAAIMNIRVTFSWLCF